MAKMVARTRLDVTFIRTLPVTWYMYYTLVWNG